MLSPKQKLLIVAAVGLSIFLALVLVQRSADHRPAYIEQN
jgi:hypothetical protein